MKQNQPTIRDGRHKKASERLAKGKSKYAAKERSGRQMYGPGCCANRLVIRSCENKPGNPESRINEYVKGSRL